MSRTCSLKPKVALPISILLIAAAGLSAQDIVENPAKPPSRDAGRVLQLTEIMRITDESGPFYFKQPADLQISADGSIFYGDWDEFLYKFDAKGKFVKNLIKKGEGPGEVREYGDVLLGKDDVVLLDTMSNKILIMDFNGRLLDEFGLGQKRFSRLVGIYDHRYYLVDYVRKDFERKSGLKETGHDLYVVPRKGETTKTPWGFPTMEAYYFGERSVSSGTITWIQKAQAQGRFVYLSSTQDYLVKLLDLEKMDIVRAFRRAYTPVKFEPPARETQWYRERGYPDRFNDIQKLLVHGDELRVLTSTIQKDRGILTDVFDREGKYADCFYLPLPRLKQNWIGYPPMAVSGSFLFTVEWNREGDIFIVQYQIGGLN
ncbi:MAG: 6-bladed beta-propeller [Candidatus Aminicenantales bacterium]